MGSCTSGKGSSLGGGGGNGVEEYQNKGHIKTYSEQHPESTDAIGEYVKAIEDLHDTGEFTDIADQLSDMFVAGVEGGTLAFYGRESGMAISEAYLKGEAMNNAYDKAVASGFHPERGDKSGVFAVMSHELGHAVTDKIAEQRGMDIDSYSKSVIEEVTRRRRISATGLAKRISGYAGHSDAECIAEAVSDVRCNGSKAKAESRAIYDILKRDYRK